MCFSNLPVEFDEDGDPYLAADADDVTRPGDETAGVVADGSRASDAEATIDEAPEEAYDAILAAMSETARSNLTAGDTAATGIDSRVDDGRERDAVEGD